MMKTLSVDIESFSSISLAKSGVYRYVESPDFEILLFGYSVDGGSVSRWLTLPVRRKSQARFSMLYQMKR